MIYSFMNPLGIGCCAVSIEPGHFSGIFVGNIYSNGQILFYPATVITESDSK